MTLAELQQQSWQVAEDKGFHSERTNSRDDTLIRLCLIHTEVAEATQEVKRHWGGDKHEEAKERLGEELADTLIRIGDLAGCCGIDLESHVAEKMAANRNRPFRYGTPDTNTLGGSGDER